MCLVASTFVLIEASVFSTSHHQYHVLFRVIIIPSIIIDAVDVEVDFLLVLLVLLLRVLMTSCVGPAVCVLVCGSCTSPRLIMTMVLLLMMKMIRCYCSHCRRYHCMTLIIVPTRFGAFDCMIEYSTSQEHSILISMLYYSNTQERVGYMN